MEHVLHVNSIVAVGRVGKNGRGEGGREGVRREGGGRPSGREGGRREGRREGGREGGGGKRTEIRIGCKNVTFLSN